MNLLPSLRNVMFISPLIVKHVITEFLVYAAVSIFEFLFAVFPQIPAMPSIIVTGWDWLISATAQATGVLIYLLGLPLYLMAIGLIIFMTTFHYVYNFVVRFIVLRLAVRFFGK